MKTYRQISKKQRDKATKKKIDTETDKVTFGQRLWRYIETETLNRDILMQRDMETDRQRD